ncbi:MAG TPA: sulfur oxidation c-type cytochrome SoxX [Acidisphaera sp.]|nr:sulfur oxidation c-type cytochrome SoxX [Acidisphaera sp.]
MRTRIAIAALGAVAALTPLRLGAQQAATMPGQELAFDRSKGNCLACHAMQGSDVPSTVGPELNDMKARFPDRRDLVAILYDEQTRNPLTVMPPFGRNMILTQKEIEQIVDFLYTL